MNQRILNLALLGEWLKDLRESAGLEPAELSSKTKINPRYLDALERGDMETLPTRVHARAFALAYAKACDADEDEALRHVAEAFDTQQQTLDILPPIASGPAKGAMPPPRTDSVKAMWGVWLALALSVALCFWGLNSLIKHFKAAVPPQTALSSGVVKPEMGVTAATQTEGEILALRSKRSCWVVLQIDGKRLPTILLEPGVKEQWQVKAKAVMVAGNIGAVRVWWRGENLGYFGELGERMNGVIFEVGQPWRKDSSQDLALPPGVPSQAPHP